MPWKTRAPLTAPTYVPSPRAKAPPARQAPSAPPDAPDPLRSPRCEPAEDLAWMALLSHGFGRARL